MKSKLLNFGLLFLVLSFGAFGSAKSPWAACTGTSPNWSTTPDYESVNTCTAISNAGDTINVSAGTATWTSGLRINKGLRLIGAGIGNSTITNARTDRGELIIYDPDNYADIHDLRITGFTLDQNNNGSGIIIGTGSHAVTEIGTKIRIDHNKFMNAADPYKQAIYHRVLMDGLVDNNIFEGISYPFRVDTGWNYTPVEKSYYDNFYPSWAIGNERTLFFEDNIITGVRWGEENDAALIDCQYAAKGYVMRYNTISLYKDSYNLMDAHGFGRGDGINDMYGCFGVEIYGNQITALHTGYLESEGAIVMAAMRTGKSMIFGNTGIGAGNFFGFHYYNNLGGASVSCADFYTVEQMIHDSYSWNNRKNFSGELGRVGADTDSLMTCNGLDNVPLKNREWFTDYGTDPKVSCGPPASRPNTCTVGQGYWSTNQSCSDLTNMVGANPATPISGTLYKCTASNIWTAYYTPYTYPHPLRTDCANFPTLCDQTGDTVAPAAPSGLTVH